MTGCSLAASQAHHHPGGVPGIRLGPPDLMLKIACFAFLVKLTASHHGDTSARRHVGTSAESPTQVVPDAGNPRCEQNGEQSSVISTYCSLPTVHVGAVDLLATEVSFEPEGLKVAEAWMNTRSTKNLRAARLCSSACIGDYLRRGLPASGILPTCRRADVSPHPLPPPSRILTTNNFLVYSADVVAESMLMRRSCVRPT